jgi:hypothetical protein
MHATTDTLPGRLQLRFVALEKDSGRLASICESLRSIAGIRTVEADPGTGAMLIDYDAAAGTNPRFWDGVEAVLEYNHLYHDQRSAPPAGSMRQLVRRSAQVLAAAWR